MPYLMGIDIGTTSARVIIVDEKGKLQGCGICEYPLYHPQPLWAEQDPLDWWEGTKKAIGIVLKEGNLKPQEIGGIGLSGQMHGLVVLDKNYEILRRSILWCDQRTAKECGYIMRKAKQVIVKSTGNPALTGFTLPKVIWIMNEEPEVYEKIHKMLLPKDYIRFKLTGEFATEVSDASGTLMLDIKKRKWSDEVLSVFRIKKETLPAVYESTEITGKITAESAKETGLKEGTPVVGGAGDQAAGGVGNGIVKEGLLSSTIGTSGVVFASLDDVKTDPLLRTHTFCHAAPKKWHVMGVMLSAGGSLRWFRDNLGMEEVNVGKITGQDPYEILTMEASQVEPCSEGLVFLPYLMGERTPYPDPYAKGVFFGLTPRHTKAHLVRAIMEGVAFGLRDSLEIIKRLGIKIEENRASGGGARSSLWRQIQADINNTPMSTINMSEGPAFGVALLAGVGTGVYKNVEESCDSTIHVTSVTEPIKENVKKYEEHYRIYRSLYHKLKDEFVNISKL